MKLREKFGNVVLNQFHNVECEILADEHAIKFAEWIKNSSVKNTDLPINILLKMYKNQKGL